MPALAPMCGDVDRAMKVSSFIKEYIEIWAFSATIL